MYSETCLLGTNFCHCIKKIAVCTVVISLSRQVTALCTDLVSLLHQGLTLVHKTYRKLLWNVFLPVTGILGEFCS